MLTERRQQQAICDLLRGGQPDLDPSQLTPPYDYLWQNISINLPDKYLALDALHTLKQEYPDLANVIETIINLKPNQKQAYESLANIGPGLPEVTWYWTNWIPRGLLTVLAADAGIGKTNVALDLARRNIMGLPAPDGTPLDIRSGNIIYVDAEGFLPVIYDRLAAWETELRCFYPIQKPHREMLDLGLKQNQDRLIDMCYDLKPDLLTIDSLSTISSKGENNVEDTREVLNLLADLAGHFNLALLLIHHLRKPANGHTNSSGPVSQHDLRGSSHLAYMARSILGLYIPGLDANGPRRLHMVKTNLCKHPRPLFMNYVPAPHNLDVMMVSYEQSEIPTIPDTQTGDCARWLLDMLEDGPMSYFELREEAAEAGYNETMLQDARKKLDWQVIDTLGVKVKGNKWALQVVENDEKSHGLSHGSNGSHGFFTRTISDETPENGHKPANLSRVDSSHMATHGPCDSATLKILTPPLSHGPCDPCDNIRNKRRQNDPFPLDHHLPCRRIHRSTGTLATAVRWPHRGHLPGRTGALLVSHLVFDAEGSRRRSGTGQGAPGRNVPIGKRRSRL